MRTLAVRPRAAARGAVPWARCIVATGGTRGTTPPHPAVAIIGAGFGGIGMAIRAVQAETRQYLQEVDPR